MDPNHKQECLRRKVSGDLRDKTRAELQSIIFVAQKDLKGVIHTEIHRLSEDFTMPSARIIFVKSYSDRSHTNRPKINSPLLDLCGQCPVQIMAK